MDIQYRVATKKDEDSLCKLDTLAADKDLQEYSLKKSDLFDVGTYFKNGGCFWVAELDHLIIGMVGLNFIGDKKAKVKALRVDPSYRGRGVAKKLMSILEQYCKNNNITETILGVSENGIAAINLYESLGYIRYETKEVGAGKRAYYYRKMV